MPIFTRLTLMCLSRHRAQPVLCGTPTMVDSTQINQHGARPRQWDRMADHQSHGGLYRPQAFTGCLPPSTKPG